MTNQTNAQGKLSTEIVIQKRERTLHTRTDCSQKVEVKK